MTQKLKAKHGDTAFTQMQYRIWSEMIVGGLHPNIQKPQCLLGVVVP